MREWLDQTFPSKITLRSATQAFLPPEHYRDLDFPHRRSQHTPAKQFERTTAASEHFDERRLMRRAGGTADSPAGDVEGGHGGDHGERHGRHRRPQRPDGGRRRPPPGPLPDLHRDLERAALPTDPARRRAPPSARARHGPRRRDLRAASTSPPEALGSGRF